MVPVVITSSMRTVTARADAGARPSQPDSAREVAGAFAPTGGGVRGPGRREQGRRHPDAGTESRRRGPGHCRDWVTASAAGRGGASRGRHELQQSDIGKLTPAGRVRSACASASPSGAARSVRPWSFAAMTARRAGPR